MGWIPPTTTFYYGQRSKCADLPELLLSKCTSAASDNLDAARRLRLSSL